MVIVGGLFAFKYARHHSVATQPYASTSTYSSPADASSMPATTTASATPNSNADVDAEVKSMEDNLNAVPSPDTTDPTQ